MRADAAPVTTGNHLAVERLVRVRGDRTVLNGVSLTVAAGERLGLIGENGVGKSTLLATLAGIDPPDAGEVRLNVDGVPGYLRQEPELPGNWTVRRCLAHARRDLDRLADRMRELEQLMGAADQTGLAALTQEYGQLQEEFGARDGWRFDARAAEVFQTLDLARLPADRRFAQLSGGERARLCLAVLLLAEPPALLLDEPTNHLDDDGLDWLAGWLAGFAGPCLIASHDRDLLDAAVTGLVDLDGPRGTVARYGGGYADYAAEQEAARRRWELAYRDWTEELAQAQARLGRADQAAGHHRPASDNAKLNYDFRGGNAQAAVARHARAARLEILRLRERAVPAPPAPLRFSTDTLATDALADTGPAGDATTGDAHAAAGDTCGQPVLAASACRTATGIELPALSLAGRDRVALTGPNGAGKSTFLRLLAGEITPERGSVRRRPGLRVGLLRQESGYRHPGRPLCSVFAAAIGAPLEEAAERLLALGLFRRPDLATPVGALSSGQRRRLDLARLVASRPQVLLLDEPTNHLSLPLIEDLQAAVAEFAGPVVVVSHDRRLLRSIGHHVTLSR